MSQVLSLQVGVPQEFSFNGQTISSSMLKHNRQTEVQLTSEGLTGDRFAHTAVHGVPDSKAYAMGQSFYSFWSKELGRQIPFGSVGENITLDHLEESQVFCGDQFQVGETILEATSPRFPCTKLNFVFQNEKAMEIFMHKKQPGVYFRVLRTGMIKSGDSLIPIRKNSSDLSIADVYELLYLRKTQKPLPADKVEKLLQNPYVSEDLVKTRFRNLTPKS